VKRDIGEIEGLALDKATARKKRKANNILKRFNHRGLAVDVTAALNKGGMSSPAQLLAAVTAGYDIRGGERGLIDIIREIQSRSPDELPTLDEWIGITQTIFDSERYRHELLPIDQSVKAAETLSKYLYSTKENVQSENVNVDISAKKLSRKEIRKFLKEFNKEY
jgi:hypothetical protein